jgi:tetratricopeptide (TPR) repeat protein
MNDALPAGTATDEELGLLLSQLVGNGEGDISAIDVILTRHINDARLHFLRGSILANIGRASEAHEALSRAVQLAPDFAIARFQLGFFELTSGEADLALESWRPLDQLPTGHFLSHFVSGLRALIVDDFVTCATELRTGIGLNTDNAPLNNDMRLIIEQCQPFIATDASHERPESISSSSLDDDISVTSLLLGRSGPRNSGH